MTYLKNNRKIVVRSFVNTSTVFIQQICIPFMHDSVKLFVVRFTAFVNILSMPGIHFNPSPGEY
jgi:hypothetical protein